MGFGYGAAIGAQIGCPDKRIIHFTGDGSFHMNLNEACTAVSQELPIITSHHEQLAYSAWFTSGRQPFYGKTICFDHTGKKDKFP